eukprot:CAMPEP_0119338792 /NCGR_PEP_ID=MMETSP1333-20130426/96914_1 /TAXON_ID=418940 /ORGANISM="Scyphosphaera apsteinii, Strain RCC1455" /LENGTH=707 /DNA_ID=CAMNT_0007350183 /DNA_START=170 /DNA_END=2293 /DNA_ORIENTATION=-
MSSVAFGGTGGRQLGEAAAAANATNRASSVGRLSLLPYDLLSKAPASRHWPFSHAAGAGGGGNFECKGSKGPMPGVSLLGALLGKLRVTGGFSDGSSPLASIALPPGADDNFAAAALADAAAIGGWRVAAMPSTAEALAEVLARKYPRGSGDETVSETIDVLVVDMGAASTCVAAVRLRNVVVDGSARWVPEVLGTAADAFLGCMDFDVTIFEHFAAQVRDKYAQSVIPGSRAGLRLLDGCERIRKLLSTLPEANTTVENLVEGADVPISLTREVFDELCSALSTKLRSLLDTALTVEGLEPLQGIEACGGGTRMPSVQLVMTEALAHSEIGKHIAQQKFGAKLDDTSVALGAALLGKAAMLQQPAAEPAAAESQAAEAAETSEEATEALKVSEDTNGTLPVPKFDGFLTADELAKLIADEQAMADSDRASAALSERRNELEGYILEARGLRARKHGELIDGARLEPLLDTAEEWLYSDEADAADVAIFDAKLSDLRAEVAEVTTAFDEAVQAARLAEEKALEASAEQAAAERAASGEADEDHDTRKLKYPDRLRLVLKNKEEGTELFQGGNFRPAAARYEHALRHAAKFVDLSPDQRAEVNSTKLSLNLNLAMCWLKITDADNYLEKAIQSCGDALAIDDKSVKALYRRATALELKKDFEAAKADLQAAAEIAPEDKAVPKLLARVEIQITRQLAKEKKMYSKMFG